MADANSINLAMDTLAQINSVKRQLISMASSMHNTLNSIDNLITNQEKKDILIDGLEGLSVDATELKNEKDVLKTIVDYITENVPKLTV